VARIAPATFVVLAVFIAELLVVSCQFVALPQARSQI